MGTRLISRASGSAWSGGPLKSGLLPQEGGRLHEMAVASPSEQLRQPPLAVVLCRQAVQRQIGPTRDTRYYSSSLSRFLQPRERDRGLSRLTETATGPLAAGKPLDFDGWMESKVLSVNSPIGKRRRAAVGWTSQTNGKKSDRLVWDVDERRDRNYHCFL